MPGFSSPAPPSGPRRPSWTSSAAADQPSNADVAQHVAPVRAATPRSRCFSPRVERAFGPLPAAPAAASEVPTPHSGARPSSRSAAAYPANPPAAAPPRASPIPPTPRVRCASPRPSEQPHPARPAAPPAQPAPVVVRVASAVRLESPRGQPKVREARPVATPQRRSTANGLEQPVFSEGSKVEYHSTTNDTWMPSRITHVDEETGAVIVDVKPGVLMDLREQQARLRPRTQPSPQHLEWGRSVLREGRLTEESRAMFLRHVEKAGASAHGLHGQALPSLGAELDSKLGICGSVCYLRHHVENIYGHPLTVEEFEEVFWNMLWNSQREFCQAVSRERVALKHSSSPHDKYRFDRTLGSGTYGTVKLATDKTTKAKRAVKMISKSTHHQDCEVEHLFFLDHPHIVKLYEHYEDQSYVYLIMDYCSGGDLSSTISESRGAGSLLPEGFVSDVTRQVLLAIAHVHARGIVHLDLKAANIMLTPTRGTLAPCRSGDLQGCTLGTVHERPHVMVIDLGVAQVFRPGNFRSHKPMGTPATMAPEAWRGEFTPKADVWSSGVVLFELLGLHLPFSCPCEHKGALAYWSGRPSPPWQRLRAATSDAAGMCRRMLVFDRLSRPSAASCLQECFVQSTASLGNISQPIPEHIVRRLVDVPRRSILHNSVALSIARVWPANQLPTIRRLFEELDTARTGRLSPATISAAIERCGVEKATAGEAAAAMDLNRDDTVDWTEFVAASLDLGAEEFEEDLQKIFCEADSDGDRLLSQQDISKLLLASVEGDLRGNVARDVFADLAGHTDEGARLDWPTFRAHFWGTSSKASNPASRKGPAEQLLAEAHAHMRDFFERARIALWPVAGGTVEPSEERMAQLAEMGFTDRGKCAAVLAKHRNIVGPAALEELLRIGARAN